MITTNTSFDDIVYNLEQSKEQLKEEIEKLNGEIAELQEDYERLEDETCGLKQEIDELTENLSGEELCIILTKCYLSVNDPDLKSEIRDMLFSVYGVIL